MPLPSLYLPLRKGWSKSRSPADLSICRRATLIDGLWAQFPPVSIVLPTGYFAGNTDVNHRAYLAVGRYDDRIEVPTGFFFQILDLYHIPRALTGFVFFPGNPDMFTTFCPDVRDLERVFSFGNNGCRSGDLLSDLSPQGDSSRGNVNHLFHIALDKQRMLGIVFLIGVDGNLLAYMPAAVIAGVNSDRYGSLAPGRDLSRERDSRAPSACLDFFDNQGGASPILNDEIVRQLRSFRRRFEGVSGLGQESGWGLFGGGNIFCRSGR